MIEPSYRKLIRIHDAIWVSDWSQEIRVASCQMIANVFGRWKEIRWSKVEIGDSNETAFIIQF
jgi:hypothetical protein